MPIMMGAAVAGGASLLSAGIGYFGSQGAARSQAQASQAALAQQAQMFQQTRNDLAPYRDMGANAMGNINQLYGWGGQGGGANFSQFYNSPDYNFAFDQGQRATTNTLNAQGNLLSGGGLAALTNYGQGMGAQQYGNYFNRLLSLTGIGQQAAGMSTNSAMGFSNAMAGSQGNIGAANASGYVGGANALSGGLTGAGSAYNQGTMNNALMQYMQRNQSGYSTGGNFGQSDSGGMGYGGGGTNSGNVGGYPY